MSLCKLCNAPQDDKFYIFCGIKCQWIYHETKEKPKMNHLFSKGQDNLCTHCGRGYIDHTSAARCESCLKCNKCEVIDGLLLCEDCAIAVKSRHFDLIAQSRVIDSTIRRSQDFHNAKTVAIMELKSAIIADSSIVNKDDALKAELLTRYEHLSVVLFTDRAALHDKEVEYSVIGHELDQLAHLLRTEERERIKIADANYVPPTKKPVKPRVPKSNTTDSALDKFNAAIKNFASLHECSEAQARLLTIDFWRKMGKKVPGLDD